MLRIKSFWYGLTIPGQALRKILSQPKLIFWSLLPILITLSLYGVLISQMQTHARALLDHSLASWGMDPQGWLSALLLFITRVLMFFLSALTFSLTATIVACPFNDFLAEQTEAYVTPLLSKVGPKTFFQKLTIMSKDLVRSLLATGVNLVALLFSWIPLLNLAALLITFLVITFQFTSYPQTRRGEGLESGLSFLWKHTYSCLGFGTSFTFLFSIPIISCLSLPLAVVGGTLLVARAKDESRALA